MMMEGQVGMMHEADDVLHGVITWWRNTDMCVTLAEPLAEVGRSSNLPTDRGPAISFAFYAWDHIKLGYINPKFRVDKVCW